MSESFPTSVLYTCEISSFESVLWRLIVKDAEFNALFVDKRKTQKLLTQAWLKFLQFIFLSGIFVFNAFNFFNLVSLPLQSTLINFGGRAMLSSNQINRVSNRTNPTMPKRRWSIYPQFWLVIWFLHVAAFVLNPLISVYAQFPLKTPLSRHAQTDFSSDWFMNRDLCWLAKRESSVNVSRVLLQILFRKLWQKLCCFFVLTGVLSVSGLSPWQ